MKPHDWLVGALILLLGVLSPASVHSQFESTRETKRPFSIADLIQMTSLGGAGYLGGDSSQDSAARYSLDKKHFVVILRRGNISKNTNDYTIFLWHTAALRNPPEALLTLSSSSNEPAIEAISWLSDNETIVFLGESVGQSHQLHAFNLRTRLLTTLTHHPTDILAYTMTPRGNAFAYVAREPRRALFTKNNERQGLAVSDQPIFTLLSGYSGGDSAWGSKQLFFQRSHSPPRKLNVVGDIGIFGRSFSIAPDGKHLVIITNNVTQIPPEWSEYQDADLHRLLSVVPTKNHYTWFRRFVLVDTQTGSSSILLSSPVRRIPSRSTAAVWSPTSTSVIITNTYLPLTNVSVDEIKNRKGSVYAVEVNLHDGSFQPITNSQLELIEWESRSNHLLFREPNATHDTRTIVFDKQGGEWRRVESGVRQAPLPDVHVEENMNTSPTLVAVNPVDNKKSLLLNFNPQLTQVTLPRVEEIHWKLSGKELTAGLYYPVHFVSEQRYPLVIQTHGWSRESFRMDGPYSTAFAAGPLASKDIMVLQTDGNLGDTAETTEEAEHQVEVYQSAIEYLNNKGLIDPKRVGIIGFSRTCLHVKYALAQSSLDLAAASVTDGVDAGYFQYLLYGNFGPGISDFSERINGGRPFGDTLQAWIKYSPGFHIDHVQTPLLITAENRDILLFEWEWFVSLSRLHKPVDMIYFQDGLHILQRPWDRLISQGTNIDWFAFWLKGEEDPDPTKAQQYARWRDLRDLQTRTHRVSHAE